MPSRAKKVTFSLREDLLAALDQAVAQGAASSKNALVERALVHELRELRRQARRSQWQEASQDPAFRQDIEEIDATFQSVDAETARSLE
jgi:metal-responsive CopG/Arc/MetJ family transcriptional regulator